MTARAPINGSTLRWARETMLMEKDELARSANTSEDRITRFEDGSARPTLHQLELIAKKLDRTLAFFFTEPPSKPDVPMTADFRSHNGEPLPPLLAREMRRAEIRRHAVLDLDGNPARPSTVKVIDSHNVAVRANEMRRLLDLDSEFTPPGNQESQVLLYWRSLLERNGFLVFQTTRIDLSVFRGLSVHHDILPIILLNGADSNNGKVFTLFHEIAHLANHTNGMCNLEESLGEEAVANAFAANFLMPEGRIEDSISDIKFKGTPSELAEETAKACKVSLLAAGVRLRTLDLISGDDLDSIRAESDKRWNLARKSQKKRGGGPAHWRVRYRDLGPGYIGTVARALEDERVDLLDASYLLDARVPTVRLILDEYYKKEGF